MEFVHSTVPIFICVEHISYFLLEKMRHQHNHGSNSKTHTSTRPNESLIPASVCELVVFRIFDVVMLFPTISPLFIGVLRLSAHFYRFFSSSSSFFLLLFYQFKRSHSFIFIYAHILLRVLVSFPRHIRAYSLHTFIGHGELSLSHETKFVNDEFSLICVPFSMYKPLFPTNANANTNI